MEFKTAAGGAQSVPAHADLKQQGNSLGGRIWKEDDQQFLVEQGKANGDEISFVFNAPEGEDEQILVHSVKQVVVGPTRMQGTLEFEAGGQQVSGKLNFTRDK